MAKRRDAKQLTPKQRKRIVAGWRRMMSVSVIRYELVLTGRDARDDFCDIASELLGDVAAETVRLVLSEEGE